MLRVRRRHGAAGGLLLVVLGAWGALIPFIGPYFHYGYTPDKTWTYNTGRLWLEILPGGAAFLGGLLILFTAGRHYKLFGALLGIVAGAWFAVGNVLAPLWTTADPAGVPASTTTLMRAMENIGLFTGLGVALVLVAAFIAGRLTAVPGVVTETPVPGATVPTETMPTMASMQTGTREDDTTQTIG
jgi:hypothetical protein